MLLFTGHSAGGAVAAMLYAHFLKCDPISEDRNKSLMLKNGMKLPFRLREPANSSNSIQYSPLHHIWSSANHNKTTLTISSGLGIPVYCE